MAHEIPLRRQGTSAIVRHLSRGQPEGRKQNVATRHGGSSPKALTPERPSAGAYERQPVPSTLSALRAALEAAGVEFIPENGGGAGGRLKKDD